MFKKGIAFMLLSILFIGLVTSATLEILTDEEPEDRVVNLRSAILQTFLGLSDTPDTYVGSSGLCVKVNGGGTGVVFEACNASAGIGDITSVTAIGPYILGGATSGNADISLNESYLNQTISNLGVAIGFNSTFNATYNMFAYNQSDGSFNATYNTFAYNQTTPAISFVNANFVPYSGATTNVNLNGKNLTNVSMVNATMFTLGSNVINTSNTGFNLDFHTLGSFNFLTGGSFNLGQESAPDVTINFNPSGVDSNLIYSESDGFVFGAPVSLNSIKYCLQNGTFCNETFGQGGSGGISNASLNALYLNLSGTNANQNINIDGWNFTTNQSILANILNATTGRIQNLFSININATQINSTFIKTTDINITRNLTIGACYENWNGTCLNTYCANVLIQSIGCA